MAVNLSPVGGVAAQFFTNNSVPVPLAGGKLYTYSAGTTTPATTYTTSTGNIPWSNPIVLNAAGRVSSSGEIWLTDGQNYKFVLKDSNDVTIATYDNISGINSNFVSYTAEQEIQTATSGQTVFTLTTMTYQPGTNSLSVFVDGVNQYGPGAQYAYTETSDTVVTFTTGLHVGAQVKFTTTQQQSAGAVDATQVSYEPPFTDSVATNVAAKLAQTVSVEDFGAVAGQNANVALQAAIDSGAQVITASIPIEVTDTVQLTLASNQTFQNIKFISTASSANDGYCFIGNAVSNVSFVNCQFELINYHRVANFIGACSDLSFYGCRFYSNASLYSAIGIRFGDFVDTPSSTQTNIVIDGCYFENLCGSAAVKVNRGKNVVVSNNIFRSTIADPGDNNRPNYPCQIDFENGTDGVVAGNTFEIPISEKQSIRADAFGYAFYQGDGTWDRLTIGNNTIVGLNVGGGCSVGIKLGGGASGSDDMTVTGNVISGTHYFSIRLENANKVTITGNSCDGATENVIRADVSFHAAITGNDLRLANSTGAAAGGGHVIYTGIDTDVGQTAYIWLISGNYIYKPGTSSSRACIGIRTYHPKMMINGNTMEVGGGPYIYEVLAGVSITVANQATYNTVLGSNVLGSVLSFGQTTQVNSLTSAFTIVSNGNGVLWNGTDLYAGNSDVRGLGNTSNKWKDAYLLNGVVVTTPDATKQYRIAVDNSGNVTSTLV